MLKPRHDFVRFDREWANVIRTARQGTNQAAVFAEQEAGTAVVSFLVESVYGTDPGNVYLRTQQALDQVSAIVVPTRGGDFVLRVESGVQYAAQIEQGNELDYFAQVARGGNAFVPRVSLDELVMQMDLQAQTFGWQGISPGAYYQRSGQNYQDPGPHVTPAAVLGAYAFADGVKRAWTRAGQLP